MISLRKLLLEYSDEEKRRLGIPLSATSRGGKWYNDDGSYAGRVDQGRFIPASQEPDRAAADRGAPGSPGGDRGAAAQSQQTSAERDPAPRNLLTNPPFPGGKPPSHEVVMAQRLSRPKGSNPGGIFKGADGKERYVKLYSNEKQALGEQISNTIYSALGAQTTNSFIYTDDGENITYASEMIDDAVPLHDVDLTQERARRILNGFATDVLLANWDTVGLEFDNIVYQDKDSVDPIRVDNGGALLTRAMGADKPEAVLDQIGEFKTLRDPEMNPNYSRVYDTADYSEEEFMEKITSQVKKIAAFRDHFGGWANFMKTFNKNQINTPMDNLVDEHQTRIVQMLESRTDKLIDLVGGNRLNELLDLNWDNYR